MLTPAFRKRLFLHQDGFILGMILGALQPRQVMSLLSSETSLTVAELARRSGANPAYLHVALRCLAQEGWLRREGTPGSGDLAYQLTATGRAVAPLFSLYGNLAGFLRRHLPLDKTLLNGHVSDPDGEFHHWVTLARQGWFDDQALNGEASLVRDQVRHHLDGNLALPIMLGLWNLNCLATPPAAIVRRLRASVAVPGAPGLV